MRAKGKLLLSHLMSLAITSVAVGVSTYASADISLPSSDADGTFTISVSGVRTFYSIHEQAPDGTTASVYGGGSQGGSVTLTREPGVYKYWMKDCLQTSRSPSCIDRPKKTITVGAVASSSSSAASSTPSVAEGPDQSVKFNLSSQSATGTYSLTWSHDLISPYNGNGYSAIVFEDYTGPFGNYSHQYDVTDSTRLTFANATTKTTGTYTYGLKICGEWGGRSGGCTSYSNASRSINVVSSPADADVSSRYVNEYAPQLFDMYGSKGLVVKGNSETSGAHVKIYPADPSKGAPNLEKVLYLVGPFDFGEKPGYSTLCSSQPDNQTAMTRWYCEMDQGLINYAQSLDVDIVAVDFNLSSHEALKNKSATLQKAVRLVEEMRQTGMSHRDYPSVMLGLSLGGVAARHALTTLEGEGFDHNISQYISFDSPHTGAYIPPALQELPIFLREGFDKVRDDNDDVLAGFVDLFTSTSVSGGAREAGAASGAAQAIISNKLDTPAVRELLVQHYKSGYQRHPDAIALQNELRSLGFPAYTDKNIAIANGSSSGSPFSFASRTYMQFDGRKDDVNMYFYLYNESNNLDRSPVPMFQGKIRYPVAKYFGDRTNYWHTRNKPGARTTYDSIPCSTLDTVDLLAESIGDTLSDWTTYTAVTSGGPTCFIPAVSAVGGDFSDLTVVGTPIANLAHPDVKVVTGQSNDNGAHIINSDAAIIQAIHNSLTQTY